MSCSNGGVSKATNMDTSRRLFLSGFLGTAASACFGQGVATRKATAQPRGKSSGLPFDARFQDVTARAGLRQVTVYGGVDRKDYIIEVTGCGCAFLDYDNDGWLDVFIPSGVRLSDTPEGTSNRLYKNNRDGTFTDVTKESGLLKTGWAGGVCVGDYNNDGFDDLFVTYWGHNVLYHNNGDGTFTDVTEKVGLHSPEVRWGTGCVLLDYNRDGFLDLFVTNYIDFDLRSAPPTGSEGCIYRGSPVNCGPKGLPKAKSFLYRNNGNGTFTDVTERSGIARSPSSYGLGVLVADFNNDSYPDIYLANDTEPSYLFWNKGDGTFVEGGMAAGVATSSDGRTQSGMGVTAGDYNCDGLLDIFKTNFSDDLPNLYRNDGAGFFEEVTLAIGLGLHSHYLGWGCGFFDADNDGWMDLLYVNGHVYPEIERFKASIGYRQPVILLHNLRGTGFQDVSSLAGSALQQRLAARGCAFGDFNNDGAMDVLINPINDLPRLLKCECLNDNNWI